MSKKSKKHQSKNPEGGIVYSTNKQWNPFAELSNLHDENDQSDNAGCIQIHYEKKGRNGKPVTIVKTWPVDADLGEHAKTLKQICGVGGSVKDSAILLQGDQRKHIENYLDELKIKHKRVGG